MTNIRPMITVYMPTKNRLQLLKRAINSVLNQTYENFELIVVDDGSNDGTQEYLQSISNCKFRYFVNEQSKGACFSRNHAINMAKGELVTGIDDDDEFTTDRLEYLVSLYDEKFSLVASSIYWDYGKRRKIIGSMESSITHDDQLFGNKATNQALVSRAKIIECGLFDLGLKSCQDWDMWTRMVKVFGNGYIGFKATYVVHTDHDSPRISSSLNRLNGYNTFYNKHKLDMNVTQQNMFKLKLCYEDNARVKLATIIELIDRHNFRFALKVYIVKNVPELRTVWHRFWKK